MPELALSPCVHATRRVVLSGFVRSAQRYSELTLPLYASLRKVSQHHPRYAALLNKAGTTLFRHEIAYVLGQMEAQRAIPTLERVLRDASDDAIVRHECGEALGAIAEPSSLVVLDELSTDTSPEVRAAVLHGLFAHRKAVHRSTCHTRP